ncbi:hypothetical protein SPI_03108 [Niveomyces insectorum RCEF 264]|uniref:Uncharacterized protein n=1 Tax=Niveomyces insectorum RCEF 264 TaxID=1081102 RepID=A0A167X2Q9_9HYPO|nr:hypothetical protein SPI_03108 [Niveomyces insectorum RCEF 264]
MNSFPASPASPFRRPRPSSQRVAIPPTFSAATAAATATATARRGSVRHAYTRAASVERRCRPPLPLPPPPPALSSSSSLPPLSPAQQRRRPPPLLLPSSQTRMQTPARPPARPPPPPGPTVASPPAAAPKVVSRVFCASLQDRPAWAPLVPRLLASTAAPRWERARLSAHDLAVHIDLAQPTTVRRTENDAGGVSGSGVFRFLLLAPADVGQPETTKRVQRLQLRKRGLGAAIVFLLAPSSTASTTGGAVGIGVGVGQGHKISMAAYQQLQIEKERTLTQSVNSLLDTNLPILPLTSLEALQATLAAFWSQFTGPTMQS